jgi:hypothetical protein
MKMWATKEFRGFESSRKNKESLEMLLLSKTLVGVLEKLTEIRVRRGMTPFRVAQLSARPAPRPRTLAQVLSTETVGCG